MYLSQPIIVQWYLLFYYYFTQSSINFKITDFGLSVECDENGIYSQSNKCPLPIKSLSIESLNDNVFSEKSDV